MFKAYLELVRDFKGRYVLVRTVSGKALMNIFMSVPLAGETGGPVLNEEGNLVAKLVLKFHFHWSRKHYTQGIDHYIWKKG